jgi:Uma2 family endonuclease
MAHALGSSPPHAVWPVPLGSGEQRFVIHGVSFKDYVMLREALDVPGLRMTYLEGALEFMSPSPDHENRKKTIARMVELYAVERGVVLYGYGNATFRREVKQRGTEPDECWVLERELQDFPDIALEVVMTSGGVDKLEVYRGLEVPEVWFWMDGAFHVYVLEEASYRETDRSRLLPGLDFDVLARFVHLNDQHEAVLRFRDWLRSNG